MFSEENWEVSLCNLGFGKSFLDMTPKHKKQKKKFADSTSSKLKTFPYQKIAQRKWKTT